MQGNFLLYKKELLQNFRKYNIYQAVSKVIRIYVLYDARFITMCK